MGNSINSPRTKEYSSYNSNDLPYRTTNKGKRDNITNWNYPQEMKFIYVCQSKYNNG